MVKFSVVIPVYNAAHTIRRCVESILGNSFQDLEVILIEDGSKDSSWDVCSQLAEESDKVKAVRNPGNKGVSYTRNQGLAVASGEYTMFVDSDDWVEATYYQEFARVLESYETDFVVCGYVNHDEKQNARVDTFAWTSFEGEKKADLQENLEDLHKSCLLQQLWNKAFRTEIIQGHQICFDVTISIGEDFRFVLDYLRAGEVTSLVMLNRPLYHYMRDQDGSLMFRVGYESVEEPLKNKRKMYELIGISEVEIEKRIGEEREREIASYAYLIMHNAGMKTIEKRRLILKLDSVQGKSLYFKNWKLYQKEKIMLFLKKMRVRG